MSEEPQDAVRDDIAMRLLAPGEADDPGLRGRLADDRQRAWWDAGWRPQAWNAWQGYTVWRPPPGTVFEPVDELTQQSPQERFRWKTRTFHEHYGSNGTLPELSGEEG